MIEFNNFSFRYATSQNYALKDVDIRIFKGEFVVVVGPSGSGKTTFLRAINGLVPHYYGGTYKGVVKVWGLPVREKKPNELTKYVSSIFQDPENQLIMGTVERELAFPLENMGLENYEISRRIEEALEVLGISYLCHRKVDEISGGEKQKVAIASAIAMHPDFLILDEPTSQLDPSAAEDILSLLERLNDDLGIGIILVEHRMERTMHRADRLIVFKDGKIIGDGEPRVIASRIDMDSLGIGYPQVARVARYMGIQYLPLTVKEGRRVISNKIARIKRIDRKKRYGSTILEVQNVYFSYGTSPVIKGLSLKMRENEILGIIGRNGAGKTTLAKLITGTLKPAKGRIAIPTGYRVGMVHQNPNVHLFEDTIYEDLIYFARDEKSVKAIMKKLGIWELRNRNSRDLSGGERMLAAIASVAVLQPNILILDEPTRGLCYAYKKRLSNFLREYSSKRGVILISHDMETVARSVDRIALLSEGVIIAEGEREDIMPGALNYTTQLNKLLYSLPGNIDRRILVEEDVEKWD